MRGALVIAVMTMVGASSFARADDAEPRFDFVLNCSGCHGLDAHGSATVPTLVGTGSLLASSEGRAYLIRVPGVAQAPLADDRLARLMNWMLLDIGGAPSFTPYTADEVAELRKDPLRDPVSARAALR